MGIRSHINPITNSSRATFLIETEKSLKLSAKAKVIQAQYLGQLSAYEEEMPPAAFAILTSFNVGAEYDNARKAFKKHGVTGKAILKIACGMAGIGWLVSLGLTLSGKKKEAVSAIDQKILTIPPEKMEELKKFFDL